MAKSKEQKQEVINKLEERFLNGKGIVFASFSKIPMEQTEALRKKCRENGIYYTVPKKTLANIALKHAGIDYSINGVDANISIAVSNDEVSSAQILADFAKGNETCKILGGALEKKFIDANKVLALSKLPSKHELLSKFVGTLQAPITGFVRVLNENLSGFVRVINAIKEQKSGV